MANYKTCKKCGSELLADDIAIHRKLISRNAEEFLCIDCLAEHFGSFSLTVLLLIFLVPDLYFGYRKIIKHHFITAVIIINVVIRCFIGRVHMNFGHCQIFGKIIDLMLLIFHTITPVLSVDYIDKKCDHKAVYKVCKHTAHYGNKQICLD